MITRSISSTGGVPRRESAIRPSGSSTYTVRRTTGPTPARNARATRPPLSTINGNGSDSFSRNDRCLSADAGFTPYTTAPAAANENHVSRRPPNCAAQPGVSSAG